MCLEFLIEINFFLLEIGVVFIIEWLEKSVILYSFFILSFLMFCFKFFLMNRKELFFLVKFFNDDNIVV